MHAQRTIRKDATEKFIAQAHRLKGSNDVDVLARLNIDLGIFRSRGCRHDDGQAEGCERCLRCHLTRHGAITDEEDRTRDVGAGMRGSRELIKKANACFHEPAIH